MSKIRVLLALSLFLGVSTAALAAEPEGGGEADEATLDALVGAVRSNRKALVAANLKLTDAEAAKFWPVYDRYQKEINAVGDRLVGVIKDYTEAFPNFSNEKAMKLVEDGPRRVPRAVSPVRQEEPRVEVAQQTPPAALEGSGPRRKSGRRRRKGDKPDQNRPVEERPPNQLE